MTKILRLWIKKKWKALILNKHTLHSILLLHSIKKCALRLQVHWDLPTKHTARRLHCNSLLLYYCIWITKSSKQKAISPGNFCWDINPFSYLIQLAALSHPHPLSTAALCIYYQMPPAHLEQPRKVTRSPHCTDFTIHFATWAPNPPRAQEVTDWWRKVSTYKRFLTNHTQKKKQPYETSQLHPKLHCFHINHFPMPIHNTSIQSTLWNWDTRLLFLFFCSTFSQWAPTWDTQCTTPKARPCRCCVLWPPSMRSQNLFPVYCTIFLFFQLVRSFENLIFTLGLSI